MSPLEIAVLAISMSVDAFAASIARGAIVTDRPRTTEAVRIGAVFGVVEAATPILGWFVGVSASQFVEEIDHWIAFGILGYVGLHMIRSAGNEVKPLPKSSFAALVAMAFATSIDAMAIGVSAAFLEVDILVLAASIGFATFAMASAGIIVGRAVGPRLGKAAGILAGLALCAIGTAILVEHLSP